MRISGRRKKERMSSVHYLVPGPHHFISMVCISFKWTLAHITIRKTAQCDFVPTIVTSWHSVSIKWIKIMPCTILSPEGGARNWTNTLQEICDLVTIPQECTRVGYTKQTIMIGC